MKKLILISSVACLTLFATVFIACNKKQLTSTKVAPYFNPPENEIYFKPTDANEAGKLVLNFLKQTKYDPSIKKTRDGFIDVDAQQGAWLVEAGANFLENPNNLLASTKQTIFIQIAKNSGSETLNSADLINEFNNLIAQIESQPNLTPLLIDVKFVNNLANEINLEASIDFGNEPLPVELIVFPTTDLHCSTAAFWLTSRYKYLQKNPCCFPPILPPGQGCYDPPGKFFYNITTTTPLCYTYPESTGNNVLWDANVLNMDPDDYVFYHANYPAFFQNTISMGASAVSVGSGFEGMFPVDVKIGWKYVPITNTQSGTLIGACSANSSYMDGFVHRLEYIKVANVGYITPQ